MWSERRLAVAECRATTLLQPCRVLQFNVATMSRARRQQRCHSKNGTWQRRCHNVNVFVGLQSVFTGKAQEAYSFLSVEDAMDYLTVKNAVLRHTNWSQRPIDKNVGPGTKLIVKRMLSLYMILQCISIVGVQLLT